MGKRAHRTDRTTQGSPSFKSVQYDLKKRPAKYVESTFKICEAIGESCDVCFLPTCKTNILCHCKIDTEAVALLLVSRKEKEELKKEAVERKTYNRPIWNKVLKMKVVQKKLKNSVVFLSSRDND